VPAAAVIRGVQALSGMIGRKASVDGFGSLLLNPRAQPWTGSRVLQDLSLVEVKGIPGGEVKFIEIGKNTSGEGALLGQY
jgi:hypothetical protein